MIAQPKRPVHIEWTGKHLYRLAGGRQVYVGSIMRNIFLRGWAAWSHGEHLGNFADEESARTCLEDYAREGD